MQISFALFLNHHNLLFMMRMEVDVQPPSLRPGYGHSNPAKRARSPDETNSPSRPAKRLTLSTASPPVFLRDSSSAGSSRQTSEDWVQQAGTLTIDSPLLTSAQTPPFEDCIMVTDQSPAPASQPVELYGRPQLAPLQTSFSRTVETHPIPKPHIPLAATPSYQHLAPAINVLPPTPDVLFPLGFSNATRPSTPSDSPMSISSSPSSANITSPSRKQRFTMGPRADCEKCRLGIKGHWVHLDQ
ncbi:hypothetical protein BT96DRAFT_634670 [Gymnopus androsaceus JB14]|uniref:Uncharacterized protein n=1 Tax=Gymnopus androsaceus JB14 TaxID=1447944 RepID=A0A6A4HP33_9AGAR|nr:hypothetical protein BT96DRAFT_634670 [Gymnopus androsaceus JB14]